MGLNFDRFSIIFEKCDFERQLLSDSYLLNFSSSATEHCKVPLAFFSYTLYNRVHDHIVCTETLVYIFVGLPG